MLAEINDADRAQRSIHGPHRRWSKTKGKLREVPPDDLRLIAARLNSTQSLYAALASRWLKANMHVGLRPMEWRLAALDAEQRTLTVMNAKHTNGRAHGVTRTLHLMDLGQDAWTDIVRFLAELHALRETHPFEVLYKRTRTALDRVRKALTVAGHKVGNVSLYSTRHQFTANLRASGRTPAEIAAMLGHATTDTQREHYGRRAKGRAGHVAAADSRDVARVKVKESPVPVLARKLADVQASANARRGVRNASD